VAAPLPSSIPMAVRGGEVALIQSRRTGDNVRNPLPRTDRPITQATTVPFRVGRSGLIAGGRIARFRFQCAVLRFEGCPRLATALLPPGRARVLPGKGSGGATDIAHGSCVGASVVDDWRRRYAEFPDPVPLTSHQADLGLERGRGVGAETARLS
jgi:hypothetical protein